MLYQFNLVKVVRILISIDSHRIVTQSFTLFSLVLPLAATRLLERVVGTHEKQQSKYTKQYPNPPLLGLVHTKIKRITLCQGLHLQERITTRPHVNFNIVPVDYWEVQLRAAPNEEDANTI